MLLVLGALETLAAAAAVVVLTLVDLLLVDRALSSSAIQALTPI
jgi:hypothetical protein